MTYEQQRAQERAQERAQRETDRAFRRMEAQRARQERHRQMWNATWSGAVQGAVNGARGMPPVQAQVRVGDAERDAAVTALSEHYVAGRLTKEEFDERTDRAWAARTAAELAVLFGDLPRLAPPAPPPRPHQRRAWWLGLKLSWIFVLLVGLAGFDVIPWFVVAIFAGLWWTGMFAGFHRWARRH